jgi:regulator of sigma E protease
MAVLEGSRHMTSIFAFLILIGVLITVHEFGHFAVAKMCGVKCEVFSIGFGKALFKFERGDTEYRLAWIPLGGYVRMLGQDPEQEASPEDVGRSLNDKTPFIRILIYAAGPAMNLLLPFLIIIPTVALGDKMAQVTSSQVGAVDASMPGYSGGLREGDNITSIDGEPVHAFWQVLSRFDKYTPDQGAVTFTVERQGTGSKRLEIIPKAVEQTHEFLGFKDTRYLIGYQPNFLNSSVAVIDPESLAAQAGIKTFDRILSVNGRETTRFIDVIDALKGTEPKKTIKVVVERLGPSILSQMPVLHRKNIVHLDFEGGAKAIVGIRHASVCITTVNPEGPAHFLKPNDCLLSVNGQPNGLGAFLRSRIVDNPSQPKTLSWIRDGKEMQGTLRLKKIIQQHPLAGEIPVWLKGFSLPQQPMVRGVLTDSRERWSHGWFRAMTDVPRNIEVTARTITGMFTGQVSPTQLSGPLTIFHLAGSAAEAGIDQFLRLMVLLSLSIGLFNLLPIPALDGGQILIASVEMVTRRPLPERAQRMLQTVGVVLILALIVFALSNDAIRDWRLRSM